MLRRSASLIVLAASAFGLATASAGAATLEPAFVREFRTARAVPQGTEITVQSVSTYTSPWRREKVAVAADSDRKCAQDSSISFQVCLTQRYLVYSEPGKMDAVNLLSYSAKWTKLDRSGIPFISDAKVRMAAAGPCAYECEGREKALGPGIARYFKKVGRPRYGKTYKYVPPWSGAYYSVNDNGYFQCANTIAKVNRRGKTWELSNPNVCQGAMLGSGAFTPR